MPAIVPIRRSSAPKPGWTARGGILAAALIATAAVVVWLVVRMAATPLDNFLAPVFRGSSPVFICAAYVPVYGLDRDARAAKPVRPEDFVDGNGRMARFLMNAMLASGGYPWTVVRIEDRASYLAALDRASIDTDVAPFAKFIAERVRWSLRQAA
jgi:hypothetical protein